jgi:succinate dehydrogenase/fumarate reductase cytochrome b subunit
MLSIIFLSEWNDSAVALLLFLFLIPVTLVFFLLLFFIRLSSTAEVYLTQSKKEKPIVYSLIMLLIFAVAFFITLGIATFFN